MDYTSRLVDRELANRLEGSGGVVIEGPKACGKTATARELAQSEVLLQAFDPSDSSFNEFQLPSKEEARVYGMATDSADTIWMVETGVRPNRMVAFDTRTETFTREAEIPSGGSSIRHMYFDEGTKAIWFGTDSNYVGRALVAPRTGS